MSQNLLIDWNLCEKYAKNIVKLQGDIKTSELEWKQVFAIFFVLGIAFGDFRIRS